VPAGGGEAKNGCRFLAKKAKKHTNKKKRETDTHASSGHEQPRKLTATLAAHPQTKKEEEKKRKTEKEEYDK
jgi:hypothetical protein